MHGETVKLTNFQICNN